MNSLNRRMVTFLEFLGIRDKSFAAKFWAGNTPKDNSLNNSEVWAMVGDLSDSEVNGPMAAKSLLSHDIPDAIVYGPKELSNGLLRLSSPLLGKATGKIAGSLKRVVMRFVVESAKAAGDVLVAPPPLLYQKEDLAIMFGMIAHELRHAADFVSLDGDVKPFYNVAEERLDMDAYATNLMEARAFADQISQMLRLMGNRTELVVEAIDKSPLMLMTPKDIREVAKTMLEEIAKNNVNESLTPAVVVKDEKNNAEKVVGLLLEIVERFKFSNNVGRGTH